MEIQIKCGKQKKPMTPLRDSDRAGDDEPYFKGVQRRFISPFVLLKSTCACADWMQAEGSERSPDVHRIASKRRDGSAILFKEFMMFYAPAIHTRHAVPAFRSFDRGLERFVNDALLAGSGRNLSVQQDDKAWTVTLDLPGVGRNELDIQVEGTAVRLNTKAESKRQFRAAYELPQEIDVDATTASLDAGVLTLVLGKKSPVSHARQIEVK